MRQKKLLFTIPFVMLLMLGTANSRGQEGIKRTDLQTHDLSIPGHEVVQQMVELQPGTVIGKHTHPGEEISVVLEGELRVDVVGKPAVTYKVGQAFTIPKGAVHGGTNAGKVPMKLLVTYVVEKGKPLRTAVQ
jgi:quercetin dioxygenase-like cupin family protein